MREDKASWTAAWQSHGELVLLHRRRALWWFAGFFTLQSISSSLNLVSQLQERDRPAVYFVVMALAAPCWGIALGYTIWRLITRRPFLKIDRTGIHYGTRQKHQIPWDCIDSISDPISNWLTAYVDVRVHGENPRHVPINHVAKADLHLFARWLRARLDEQRKAAGI